MEQSTPAGGSLVNSVRRQRVDGEKRPKKIKKSENTYLKKLENLNPL
jgi:hypothetical protein